MFSLFSPTFLFFVFSFPPDPFCAFAPVFPPVSFEESLSRFWLESVKKAGSIDVLKSPDRRGSFVSFHIAFVNGFFCSESFRPSRKSPERSFLGARSVILSKNPDPAFFTDSGQNRGNTIFRPSLVMQKYDLPSRSESLRGKFGLSSKLKGGKTGAETKRNQGKGKTKKEYGGRERKQRAYALF